MLVYRLYRALTYGVSPFIHLHMRWRRLRGLEHFRRWHERFGHPSAVRPPGSLVWFHAVSLGYKNSIDHRRLVFKIEKLKLFFSLSGEGMAAVPVIRRCNEMKPEMTILMTTTTLSALYCFFPTLQKKTGFKVSIIFFLFFRFSEVIRKQLPAGVLHQVCMCVCFSVLF